jgi:hypothetical protein
VDGLPGHPEHVGNVSGGSSTVELKHSEGPAIEAGIRGLLELSSEAAALPVGQFQPAHDLPPR